MRCLFRVNRQPWLIGRERPQLVERLWRSLKYEEIHLKAYANGLAARSGISQWFRFYNESRPHQALGYKTPAAWAAEVSPVDLPLRLDDAGRSPTTPQGQQQQNVVYT